MPPTTDAALTSVVVATFDNVLLARATVRTLQADGHLACLIVDVDGAYRPVAGEQVVSLLDVVTRLDFAKEAMTAAVTLEPDDFVFYAGVLGASYAVETGADGVLVLGAGVHVLSSLRSVLEDVSEALVVPFLDGPSVVRRASAVAAVVRRERYTGLLTVEGSGVGSLYNRAIYGFHDAEQASVLRALAADWRVAGLALDAFAVAVGATVVSTGTILVSPWREVGEMDVDAEGRLCIDSAHVQAVDLTAFDARWPWTLDAMATTNPSVLLSEHPALARFTRIEAEKRIADLASLIDLAHADELSTRARPVRVRLDSILRTEARRAQLARGALPDLLGPAAGAALESWALGAVPVGDPQPVARYLAAVRLARPDVQHVFQQVPGPDVAALARWATESGVDEPGLDAELLARAAEATLAAQRAGAAAAKGPRAKGVNLVGYLAGELGLGVSARLMDNALQSAGVSTTTYDVGRDLESRQGAEFRQSAPVMHDTTLLCINAADTPAVAPRLDALLRRTRVIGMWYWELEDFPAAHHAAFRHVDEVWAATDFMRDAIVEHAGEIPVRTVTPPLPQAGDDPGVVPERFGIPADRPFFLFTFDYFSSAVRKNPFGLIEAFTRAFDDRPAEQRPLLVIKTINAAKDPVQAERLRFQIARRTDVMLLDAYLDDHERHVLVSHCTAYVSLHKAEGLGLTVAEAMAWGRPVITTAYGGVMQFCNDQNAFLVHWQRGYVEETVGPYEKGLSWAEPDLDHAAGLMRTVIEDPERAAALGAQAARDVREFHNAEVAGAHMRKVLEEGNEVWQARRIEVRARRRTQGRQRRELAAGVEPAQARGAKAWRLVGVGRATARRRIRAAMSRRAHP